MPSKPIKSRKPRILREKSAMYKTASHPGLQRRDQKALAEFRAQLSKILPNGALKSLIVYGSKARGESHHGSDIDVLIVYDSTLGEKKQEIRQAADEITMSLGGAPDIEPLIRTEKEIKEEEASGTPILQNIAREGIVLDGDPIMPEHMDRKEWSTKYIQSAKRTLRTARLALADGDIDQGVSLAYFVYLDAARAALIAKNIAPQSHAGSRSLFGLHFVKTGLLPSKFAAHFQRLEEDRLEATYAKKKQLTQEDAERALERAEELLNAVEALLPKLLKEK